MTFGFWQEFYYPLGLAELKIFLEKEIAWYLCNHGRNRSQNIQREAELN